MVIIGNRNFIYLTKNEKWIGRIVFISFLKQPF